MNTGLPIVLGWEYHVFQRSQSRAAIERRQQDIELIYTSPSQTLVAAALARYHVALVFVGSLERQTYRGANLLRFRAWSDLLAPLYESSTVSIFGVQGQPARELPAHHQGGEPGGLRGGTGSARNLAGAPRCGLRPRRQRRRGRLPQPSHPGTGARRHCRGGVGAQGQRTRRAAGAHGRGGGSRWLDLRGRHLERPHSGVRLRGRLPPRVGRGLLRSPRHRRGPRRQRVRGRHRQPPDRALRPQGEASGWRGARTVPPRASSSSPWGSPSTGPAASWSATAATGGSRSSAPTAPCAAGFPVPGWRREVFSEPHVAVDPWDRLWVTVPLAREVRAYAASGELLRHRVRGQPAATPPDPGRHRHRPVRDVAGRDGHREPPGAHPPAASPRLATPPPRESHARDSTGSRAGSAPAGGLSPPGSRTRSVANGW